MSDPVDEFFSGLAHRGYEPLLHHSSGSIRFDLRDGGGDGGGDRGVADHWRVTIDHGTLSVEHDDGPADTIVVQDRSVLAEAVAGTQNLMNAIMLGQIGFTGDIEKLVSFQRLFGNRPAADQTATRTTTQATTQATRR